MFSNRNSVFNGSAARSLFGALSAMAAVGAMSVATDASAAFTGFSITVSQEGTLKRYVLYANFSGATDTVLNAFHFNRTINGGTPVFRHNDAISGGVSSAAGTWNPQFLLVPGALDSYVCIGGGEGFASGNSTNADPDWGAAGFNQAQVPFFAPGTTTGGPGWFNGNPPNNQGLQSGGKVKLGQFVLGATDPSVVLFIKMGYNTGPNTTVVFAEGTFTLTGTPCTDCDGDNICDSIEIAQNPSLDCDANGALDSCQIAQNPSLDCNANGKLDSCDIAQTPSLDCNGNGKLDSCDLAQNPSLDCNGNGKLDSCDIAQTPSLDCNGNGKIDSCDIAQTPSLDCNGNGKIDSCDIAQAPSLDCDGNGRLDSCDLVVGAVADCNSNGVIDACEGVSCGGFQSLQVERRIVGSQAVHTLFVKFAGTSNILLNAFHIGVISGAPVFRHSDGFNGGVNSSTVGSWNPNLALLAQPADSFVLIGGGVGAGSANTTLADPDFLGGFNQAQMPFGANPGNGPGWYNSFPPNFQGQSNAYGRVRIGQFTTGVNDAAALLRIKFAYYTGVGTPVVFGNGVFRLGSADCDGDGISDEVEVANGTGSDCNGDGLLDSCEIANGGTDCNSNGLPDSCDLLAGSTVDCNGNGQLDSCELAAGTAFDCNGNGRIDSCDVAAGLGTDCDNNGQLDACQLQSGSDGDCDGNGVLDACDIVLGNLPDCDLDGVPDVCEGASRVDSTQTFTFSGAAPVDITFTGLPRAYAGLPRLEVRARADLGSPTDALVVSLDGASGNTLFLTTGSDCPANADFAQITRSLPVFNAMIGDGQLVVRVAAIGAVNTANCADGVISLRLVYDGLPAASDCNLNGLLDSCEIDTGLEGDCNGNRIPDSCEIASGSELDCNSNGIPDSCDLDSGTSTDLDSNGVPDECSGEWIVGGTGFGSIQAAVDAAPDGTTVRVGAGVYSKFDLTGRAIRLVSLAGAAQTVVDGGGTARCFCMFGSGPGETLVDGFTFRNGSATSGGAASIVLSGPTFLNCVFADSVATSRGGAVMVDTGAARFVDCTFTGNDAAEGGAVAVMGDFTLAAALFEGCEFTGNAASLRGGAILNAGGIELSGCTLELNSAPTGGAASFLAAGNAVVGGSRFCRNTGGNIDGAFTSLVGNILSQDCDGDGVCDYDAIGAGTVPDCNLNGLPDACDISSGTPDCNANGVPDACDISAGTSVDIDLNSVPDECQPDCDGDALPDSYEIAQGASDCNANAVPDSCDLASGGSTDLNSNGIPDECSGEWIVGGSGYQSIQSAINAAPQGATVRVAPGSYGAFDLTGRAVSLISFAGPSATFLDGGGVTRSVSMQGPGPGMTRVEGFTIRNGFADCGGAVRVTLSAPIFVNCVFSDNETTVHGGAVALHGTAAQFFDCVFTGNHAPTGGAIWIEGLPSTGQVVLSNCTFIGNEASGVGGAIYSTGVLLMQQCLVEANDAALAGGAAFAETSQAGVGTSRFCRNTGGNTLGSFNDLAGNLFSEDCDGDGLCDADEISDGTEPDCNSNGVPDSCDIGSGAPDCNSNGVPDSCDIALGTSNDIDLNGVPDECKPDCDGDGIPDAWELANGLDLDCNANGVIDSCDIQQGAIDDDNDGRIDLCEFALGDINLDDQVNGADLSTLLSLWSTEDPAAGDLNGDGMVNALDLALILDNWGPLY